MRCTLGLQVVGVTLVEREYQVGIEVNFLTIRSNPLSEGIRTLWSVLPGRRAIGCTFRGAYQWQRALPLDTEIGIHRDFTWRSLSSTPGSNNLWNVSGIVQSIYQCTRPTEI